MYITDQPVTAPRKTMQRHLCWLQLLTNLCNVRGESNELLARSPVYSGHSRLPGGLVFEDHLEMYLQFECKQPVSIAPALKLYNQAMIGAEWLFNGLEFRNQPTSLKQVVYP